MGKLIVFQTTSLDGYVADRDGRFDWTAPDDEVLTFVNEVLASVGTYLQGRAMHEVMTVWEDPEFAAGQPAYMEDFAALWRDADKIVYSRTLSEVSTARTRLERELDPSAISELKVRAERDLVVGGSDVA